ncbi:MAG: hypothetical protein ABIS07_00165 [Dokdonella sp.]
MNRLGQRTFLSVENVDFGTGRTVDPRRVGERDDALRKEALVSPASRP